MPYRAALEGKDGSNGTYLKININGLKKYQFLDYRWIYQKPSFKLALDNTVINQKELRNQMHLHYVDYIISYYKADGKINRWGQK